MMNRSPARLLRGCASVIAFAAAWSAPSHAQTGFQGTPSVITGSASINPGRDTITVNTAETVINWTPSDTSGTGVVDFLPAGNAAQFQTNVSVPFSDYTVLNRILPVDGGGLPVSRIVALNGTVQSSLFGSTGGKIWFYAPGGIIAGPSSVFNVGSLVLTSNDIDTTGGLYGSNGEIRFRGAAGSTSAVEVQAGAQINALAAGSYVALVAPRVVQAGTVNVDGSVAYVGAEQADVRINSGLFDITITAGTGDANGVVHSGTTTGPGSSGIGDSQRIYMVAVPKNNALTMLLSGSMGYTPAVSATSDDNGVVLSAGFDVAGGFADFAPSGTQGGNASGHILVQSGSGTPTHFLNSVTASAENGIALNAAQFGSIVADGDMILTARNGAKGGTIDLLTFGGTGDAATNGQISIAGSLGLNANGLGNAGVSAPPLIGEDANGGSINLIATGGLIQAASLNASASGYAGFGSDRSGNATGGAITLSALTAAGPSGAEGGTLRFGSTTLDASAAMGFQSPAPPIDGGNAMGGSIMLTGTAGVASIGATGGLDLGAVTLSALATGGDAGAGLAGSATGGNIGLILSSGTHSWSTLDADVSATAGSAGDGGRFGGVTPGATGIDIDVGGTGSLVISGGVSLYADAAGAGGLASGATLRGGRIAVAAHDGGSLSIAQSLYATANARGYSGDSLALPAPGTPDAIGGTISIGAAGGSFSAADLSVYANGSAGGAPGAAGNGTGGNITLSASMSGGQRGSFSLDCTSFFCEASANGDGGYGLNGGNGTGGTILLYAADADFSALGDLQMHAEGHGGGTAYDGLPGRGGDGLGGSVTVESRAGTGVMTFGNLSLSASGTSVPSIEGISFNDGDGGNGTGGTVNLNVLGGSLTAGMVDVQAAGFGGASAMNCPSPICEGGGTTPFRAGNGLGGTAGFLISGGTATIGTLTIGASGSGGAADGMDVAPSAAALAGTGQGGTARMESRGGDLQITTLDIDASGFGGEGMAYYAPNGANGGTGTGGNAGLLMTAGSSGQVRVDGGVTVQALGNGGNGGQNGFDDQGLYSAGAGGGGTGGTVDVTLAGGMLTTPFLSVLAVGTGGNGGSDNNGGAAGDGAGGTARFSYLNEGHLIGDVTIKADGLGGQAGSSRIFIGYDSNFKPIYDNGNGSGGAGGDGAGGNAAMLVDVDPAFTTLIVSADGIGSTGGNGVTGSDGGVGTGGIAALNLAFGATAVSDTLSVTANGLGGLGGSGYDDVGGRGGDAFGGSATLALSGTSTVLDAGDIAVLAQALGGMGGAGGLRSGSGLAGAAGGHATGGNALFDISAGATAVLGAALRISGDATGGAGAPGTAGALGGAGGAGGNASAGSATWRIDGAHLGFATGLPRTPGYTITAVGQGGMGADGSAGSNAGLSGGTGGRGGDGQGGTAAFQANDGDYALGGLDLLADGSGGVGGTGGNGPAGASAAGLAGLGAGGAASFVNGDGGTLMPGAQRLIDALTMRASGTTGGRVTFADNSMAVNGGLRVSGSVGLVSAGAPVAGFSGISVSAANRVQIGGNADFTSDGPLAFAFAGIGGVAVTGALTGTSGTNIALSHSGRPAGSDSLSADSILFTTPGDVSLLSAGSLRAVNSLTILSQGGNINLASGSVLDAGTDLRLYALGSLDGAGASVAAGGAVAIGLGSAGDILLGNLTSGGLLDQADASGNALGTGGIAIGGDFAVSGQLSIGAGSGTISAASIVIGTLLADSQSLTASSGGIRVGNAALTGLLQLRALNGLAQLTGQVTAGSIDIAADGIASNGLGALTGDLLLQSGTSLTVTNAQAAGAIGMTASTGGLTIGNAIAGGNLSLTGLGISAQRLGAGGQSLLNAGTGVLSVADIASTGAITANGAAVSLGAGGAMIIAQATATAGALTLDAGGDLSIANASATGPMTVNAGGLANITGTLGAPTIAIASGDIAIGNAAQIGSLSGTTSIGFRSVNGQQPAYIGGGDVTGAYSLSAAELARAAAGNIAIDAPSRGTATPDLIVQDLTLGAANLASGGTLSIGTGGRLRVQGALRLTGRSGQGGLALSAGQALEIIAGPGLIDISDVNGGLAGVLSLSAPSVIAATLSALSDVAATPTLNGRELRLAQNDGLVSDAGTLRAGTISVDVSDAFYIQNSGISNLFTDRRGFTADRLLIASQGTRPQIAINGQLVRSTGGFATGLETIPLVAIAGGFAPGSKINGCLIGGACFASTLENRDTLDAVLDPSVAVGRIFTLSLIELRDIIAQGYPPLIDEPVTGAGNEDLWERSCGSADEPGCGDNDKR
ncbi:histidine kinase [Sphingobium sp. LB126]|uniref:histidine kinase n=1 Tax=Sphingobium sp. LB126 TaxID=1983755 RepID=UPI000C2013A3|nr:histidine kinase [Sphingobium sp. LB126]PJG46187.1 histidine kinase [Sphingobium sp. LB126]